MTVRYNQVSAHREKATDITFYSAAALTAGQVVVYTTVSGEVNACALPTNGNVTNGTELLAGVVVANIAAGSYGPVCVHGPVVAIGHTTIAQGQQVIAYDATSHLGECTTLAFTSNQEGIPCLGRALTAATSTDADYFELFVNIVPATTSA